MPQILAGWLRRWHNGYVPYPIFPSLTRAPAYECEQKIEDGTIADPMESGYISTRPRFTRLRRTWKCSYKNLIASDVILLDQFARSVVFGGAGAFYLPNLLVNGSFEVYEGAYTPGVTSPATFDGWQISPIGASDVAVTVGPPWVTTDGTAAIYMPVVQSYVLPPGNDPNAAGLDIHQIAPVSVTAGDTLLISGKVYLNPESMPAGGILHTEVFLSYDAAPQDYLPPVSGSTSGFVDYSQTVTVPTGCSAVQFGLLMWVENAGVSDITLVGFSRFYWDQLGLAVTSPAYSYGKMPGSSPLGVPVRFSKPIAIRDAMPALGVKRYDVSFEVTEL